MTAPITAPQSLISAACTTRQLEPDAILHAHLDGVDLVLKLTDQTQVRIELTELPHATVLAALAELAQPTPRPKESKPPEKKPPRSKKSRKGAGEKG